MAQGHLASPVSPAPAYWQERAFGLWPDSFSNADESLQVAVVDHLPSLTVNVYRPSSAKGIQSKAQLLARVERLFLEYCDKGHAPYTTLMRHGGAFFNLCGPKNLEVAELCGEETDWMTSAAAEAGDTMVNLLSISTGALFGGQTDIWQPIWQTKPPILNMPERMRQTRGAISALIKPKRMSYFCQHVHFGPLTYISQFWYAGDLPPKDWRGPKGIEHRHIDAEAGNFPVIVGGNSRWYCTFSDAKSNYAIQDVGSSLVRAIGSHMLVRETGWRRLDPARSKEAKHPFISVDAYLPPRFMERDVLDFITESTRDSLAANPTLSSAPRSHTSGDSRRYKSIKNAPPCEACGWCVDDLQN